MRHLLRPPKALLIALSVLLVSGCKPTLEEEVNEALRQLDLAFIAYKDADYDRFSALMSEAGRPGLFLEPLPGVPEASIFTRRDGRCDLYTLGRYHAVMSSPLEEMLPVLQGTRLTGRERRMAASALEELSRAVKRDLFDIMGNQDQRRDCDRYFPQYSNRLQAVEDYARASLPSWLAAYEVAYGSNAIEDAKQFSRIDQMMDLGNWGALSPQEKEYFTFGDPEVENCIVAFIDKEAPSPEVANTEGIARLCRQGLD